MTSFNEGNVNRSTDGKFAAKITGETSLDALADHTPSVDTVIEAHGQELDRYVHHHDTVVRVAAAANPHLSDEQVSYLSDPDVQPAVVRLEVARSGSSYAYDALIDDPSPTVRAFISQHWNASNQVQSRPSDRTVQSALGLDVAPVTS